MRVSNWNPQAYDGEIMGASMERLRAAAEVVAEKTRTNLRGIIRHETSRPVYKKGPYAGEPWTARTAGALLKTVRVVEKTEKNATLIYQIGNIRVYCGNFLVYYALAFEYAASSKRGKAFLRPALNSSKETIKSILENG